MGPEILGSLPAHNVCDSEMLCGDNPVVWILQGLIFSLS